MKLNFVKYEGCGNDFIIAERGDLDDESCARISARLCERRLGIGADGMIFVSRDPLTMDIWNSDGSRAPMCGNGIRCFAAYVFDLGICDATSSGFDVRTLAGVKRVKVISRTLGSGDFEIDMGSPDYSARALGMDRDGEFLNESVEADGRMLNLSGVNTGTVHIVVWLDDNELTEAKDPIDLYCDDRLREIGRVLSSHDIFPERANINFARIITPAEISMITWERGAGLTAACGTGACAAAVLGMREKALDSNVCVRLPYGELGISMGGDHMFMRGPASRIFEGIYGF